MDGYNGNEIMLRNHPKIRKVFAEIICILCLSTKKHPYSAVQVKKTDFASVHLTDKLKAKNIGRSIDPDLLVYRTNVTVLADRIVGGRSSRSTGPLYHGVVFKTPSYITRFTRGARPALALNTFRNPQSR